MKTFLKWTGLVVGVAVAGTYAVRTVAAGRQRLKSALGRAEAVADHTRAALEETEAALRDARTAL